MDPMEEEEMIMSLRELVEDEDSEGQGLAEDLKVLLSMAAALRDVEVLPPESWDWAEDVEPVARRAVQTLSEEAEDIQRALSVLSRRPGEEEAFVAALRRQAASTAAQLADAAEVAAATRRLREKELRRLAAAQDVAHPDMARFTRYVASETDTMLLRGHVPAPDELAVAAVVEGRAAQIEGRMATLAGRFRRGAAEFAEGPGEEALVEALHRQAANADAMRATMEEFTASVRRFRAAGSALPAEGAARPAAAAAHASAPFINLTIQFASLTII